MRHSRQLVAYQPDLGGTKDQKKKVGYDRAKRDLYHKALAGILKPIRDCNKAGGFVARRVRCRTWNATLNATLNVALHDRQGRMWMSSGGLSFALS